MKNTQQPPSGRSTCRRAPRRGMALLFVVSLILFITLLAASFVAVSQQFSKSAEVRTRIDARGDSDQAMVYRALYDVLRGPDPANANSPLRGHSLLADMYGYGVRSDPAGITNFAAIPASGFVDLQINPVAVSVIDGSGYPLSRIDDHYNGQVLTFTSGPARGISCRVVDYFLDTTNNQYVFRVLPEAANAVDPGAMNLLGSQVVLNGKPFSGFGASSVDKGVAASPALLPRRMSDDPLVTSVDNDESPAPPPPGSPNAEYIEFISTGVNESYDALDYQNMFLAMYDEGAPDGEIKASFNRPNLFSTIESNSLTDEEKYANFRPVTGAYAVTGPATAVTAANGWASPSDPLDVDNDGDGVLDSIWIDPGYPVKTDIDGRRYKTLVAYMIRDMDSRLNLNAHGNGFHLDPFVSGGTQQSVAYAGNLLGQIIPMPSQLTADNLPRGHYLGSPEVSLLPLFDGTGNTVPERISGAEVYARILLERNGPDGLPGIGNLSGDPADLDFRDSWIAYENRGHPDTANRYGEAYPNQFVGGHFGTYLDMHGRYPFGIPQIGDIDATPVSRPTLGLNPNFSNTGNEIASSAYELSLFPESRYPITPTDASDDQPYRAWELERLLRPWDRDTKMLPGRLTDTVSPYITAEDRHFMTTDSFEVPALPSFDTGDGVPRSIVEVTYDLLVGAGMAPQVANQELAELLAPEVRMGLPMNLNRPFGNGRDDNNNGVYDEHWQNTDINGANLPGWAGFDESFNGERVVNVQGSPVAIDSSPVAGYQANHLARQIFARHLYVLALLATGDTATIASPDFSRPFNDPNVARRVALAQWAINVVDMRDSDSINTPFECDINPFNQWTGPGGPGGPGLPGDPRDTSGWSVDGFLTASDDPANPALINTDRFVVWGAERPELLISETLATHDRRTEDLDSIGGGDVAGDDDDFDSKLVPRSAAWFELYHPWNQNDSNQLLPAELSDPGRVGIDLRKVTPAGDPVWRILVLRDQDSAGGNLPPVKNPDSDDISGAEIARKIYFTQPNTSSTATERENYGGGLIPAFTGQKVFYPGGLDPAVITRGGFGVIGSGGVGADIAAPGEVLFGRRSDSIPFDASSMPTTRRITLDPAGRQVIVYEPRYADSSGGISVMVPENTKTRPDVAGVIIDTNQVSGARSLGLSDPDDGYASFGPQGLIADGFEFLTGLDEPVDGDPADPYRQFKMTDGVSAGFSNAHLQRLANPLAPYHPATNPYLTVDSKSLDLVAFNGAEDDSADQSSANPNALVVDGDMVFSAGERGRLFDPLYRNAAGPDILRRLIWQAEDPTSDLAQAAGQTWFANLAPSDRHVHSFNLYETLGEMNGSYTGEAIVPRFPRPATNMIGGANPPLGFSGLTWNNRPFAGHMDLLDVPYPDSFGLLESYTQYLPGDPYQTVSAFPDSREFGHLFNFFLLPDPAAPSAAIPANMAALLDYVRVPSRWAGTRQHLPSSLPPYNVLSRYREPGKINLNTISRVDGTDSPVWEGLLDVYATGYSVGTTNGQLMDGSPAEYGFNPVEVSASGFEGARRSATGMGFAAFDNPFRTASEFDKVPSIGGVGGFTLSDPVQATLLRNESPAVTPLFDYPQVSGFEVPCASPTRDSAVRHDVFRRLANTTTTRSSVYAIWVTVGRFEVDENDRLLGPRLTELGADTGKVRRGRGFFMVDRSIPVGFEPGKNHNVEKTITVESIID